MSRRRAPSLIALLAVACALAAGCSGSSGDGASSGSLTPLDAQRYVNLRLATANMTRLIQLIATADNTVGQLVAAKPGSPLAGRLTGGSRTGWNNVLVGLGSFTQGQAAVVDGLAEAVSATRQNAIDWDTALAGVAPGADGRPSTKAGVRAALARLRAAELRARDQLRDVVGKLARQTCDIEKAHHELNTPGGTASSCAAALQLDGE